MAQAVSQSKAKLKVPSALMTLLGRAIEARKQAAAWVRSGHVNGDQYDGESDQRHGHFIEVLETIAGILKVLVAPPKKVASKALERSKNITNKFADLTVEHSTESSSEDVYEQPDESTLPRIVPVSIEQTEAEVEEEFFFAIHSFLKTIHSLRELVQDVYFMAIDGHADNMNAAFVANTAIDLTRKAEEEFEFFLKRLLKYPASRFSVWTLPGLLYYNHHASAQKLPACEALTPGKGLVGYDGKDCPHLHWSLIPVYTGLKAYLNKIIASKNPSTATPSILFEDCDCIGGVHPDTLRACNLAVVFRIYDLGFSKSFAVDEATRGAKYVFKFREIPIWTTFGIQLLLDIQNVMDHSMGKGKGPNQQYSNFCVFSREELRKWEEFLEWKRPWPVNESVQKTRDIMTDNLNQIRHKGVEHQFDAVMYNPI